jgi:hypothetical protein
MQWQYDGHEPLLRTGTPGDVSDGPADGAQLSSYFGHLQSEAAHVQSNPTAATSRASAGLSPLQRSGSHLRSPGLLSRPSLAGPNTGVLSPVELSNGGWFLDGRAEHPGAYPASIFSDHGSELSQVSLRPRAISCP